MRLDRNHIRVAPVRISAQPQPRQLLRWMPSSPRAVERSGWWMPARQSVMRERLKAGLLLGGQG